MTDTLIYILGIFLFVMIFALGFILGHHQALSKPQMAVAQVKREETAFDEEEKLRIEAEQKAFQDCMNYNIESAYKMGGKS